MVNNHRPLSQCWVVPEAGIEPARLAARDFLATSAFAAEARASFVVWSAPLPWSIRL